jgi:hypothetical protein
MHDGVGRARDSRRRRKEELPREPLRLMPYHRGGLEEDHPEVGFEGPKPQERWEPNSPTIFHDRRMMSDLGQTASFNPRRRTTGMRHLRTFSREGEAPSLCRTVKLQVANPYTWGRICASNSALPKRHRDEAVRSFVGSTPCFVPRNAREIRHVGDVSWRDPEGSAKHFLPHRLAPSLIAIAHGFVDGERRQHA